MAPSVGRWGILGYVDHAQNSKHLDGADTTTGDDACTNFTHIQGVIVTTAAISVGVDEGRIFPGLREASIVEENISLLELFRKGLRGVRSNI